MNLPALDEEKNRADIWWYQLKGRYPTIRKVSLALLSIFHGPRVESSFSVKGNISDKQSGCMNVDTYSAIQTLKYNVLDNPASKNSVKSISSFKREDKLHTPMVSNLCYNMCNARGRYKPRLKDIAKENKEKKKILPWYRQTKSTHKERIEKKKECTPKQTRKI